MNDPMMPWGDHELLIFAIFTLHVRRGTSMIVGVVFYLVSITLCGKMYLYILKDSSQIFVLVYTKMCLTFFPFTDSLGQFKNLCGHITISLSCLKFMKRKHDK